MSVASELTTLSTLMADWTNLKTARSYERSASDLASIAATYLATPGTLPVASLEIAKAEVLRDAAAKALPGKENAIVAQIAVVARAAVTANAASSSGPSYLSSQVTSWRAANPSLSLPDWNGFNIEKEISDAARQLADPHW